MAINDGAIDKKKVNVGWMEVLSDGWPYVFVVALRGGVKKRQELLLDYSSTRYWEARAQSAFEDAGPLKALRDPALVRARERLGALGVVPSLRLADLKLKLVRAQRGLLALVANDGRLFCRGGDGPCGEALQGLPSHLRRLGRRRGRDAVIQLTLL